MQNLLFQMRKKLIGWIVWGKRKNCLIYLYCFLTLLAILFLLLFLRNFFIKLLWLYFFSNVYILLQKSVFTKKPKSIFIFLEKCQQTNLRFTVQFLHQVLETIHRVQQLLNEVLRRLRFFLQGHLLLQTIIIVATLLPKLHLRSQFQQRRQQIQQHQLIISSLPQVDDKERFFNKLMK